MRASIDAAVNPVAQAIQDFPVNCREAWRDFEDQISEYKARWPDTTLITYVEGYTYPDEERYVFCTRMASFIRRALYQCNPGLPIYAHPKALTALRTRSNGKPLTLRGVFEGTQGGEKISMVEMSTPDYRVRIEAKQTSLTFRVTLTSKQP